LLYNYGRDLNIIEAFSSNMKLKWKRSINLKVPGAFIRKIIVYPDKNLVFYYTQEKEVTKYFAEIFDVKFQSISRPILLDSLSGDKYELTDMRVVHSQDKSHIVIYTALYENGENLHRVLAISLNDQLKNIEKNTLNFADIAGLNVLRKVLLSNAGRSYFLIENTEKKSRKEPYSPDKFRIYENTKGQLEIINFLFDKAIYDKLFVEIDNVNNQLIATALFYVDDNEMSNGYFFQAIDIDSNQIRVNNAILYEPDLLYDITGKELDADKRGLFSFEITDVILKYDGGIVLVTESIYESVEEIQTPSFVPAAGPGFRTINITYYNDLVIHSLSPNGSYDWSQIVRKKQVSEDDNGYYSSYALFNVSDKLHFIYNEEVHPRADVDDSVLWPNGEVNRNYLFNTGDQNVLLVPRVGKQVSENELVIPSFRKNYLTLLKLSY